jgi:purine-binding chemotaxis protein CheW
LSADDELHRILRKRAATLAAPRPAAPATDVVELVVFRSGSRRYAIDAIEAEEAIEIADVTPLPGLPAFYRGLIIHQGVVYPLVDIRPLVGTPIDDETAPAQAILFSSPERTIAVAAASVESFVQIDASSIAPPDAADPSRVSAIRGVTGDGIVLLDVHVLLADARLVIDD